MLVTLRLHSDRDGCSCEVNGYSLSQLRSSCEYMRSFLDFGLDVANLPCSEDEQSGDDVVHNIDTGSCSALVAAGVLHYLVKGPSEAPLVVDGSNAAELLSLADLWCLDDIKAIVLGTLRRTLCNGFRRPVAGANTVTTVPQVAVLARQALAYGIGDPDGGLRRLYDDCVAWMAGWLARSWPNRTFAGLARDIQGDVLRAAKQCVTADTAPAVLAACRQLSGMPAVAWAQRVQDMRGELASHTLSFIWGNFAEVCEQAGGRRDRTECWGALLEELLAHVAANPDPDAAVRALPRWAAATRALLYGNAAGSSQRPLGSDPASVGDAQGWLGEEEELQLQELYEHLRSYCVRHLPLLSRCAAFRALPLAQQQHILQVAQTGVGGAAVVTAEATVVGEATSMTEHTAASGPHTLSGGAGGSRSGGSVAWVISGAGDTGGTSAGTTATRTPPPRKSAPVATTPASLSMSRRREIRSAWTSPSMREQVNKRDVARQGTGAGGSCSGTSTAAPAKASTTLTALASPDALAAAAALADAAAAAPKATPAHTPARTAAAQAMVTRPATEPPKTQSAANGSAARTSSARLKSRLTVSDDDPQPNRVASPRSSYLHETIAAGFAAGRSARRRDAVPCEALAKRAAAPTARPAAAELGTSSTDSGFGAAVRHDIQGGKRPHDQVVPKAVKQAGNGHARPKHSDIETPASAREAYGLPQDVAGDPNAIQAEWLEDAPAADGNRVAHQQQAAGQPQGPLWDGQQQPAVEKTLEPAAGVAAGVHEHRPDWPQEGGLPHALPPFPQPCVNVGEELNVQNTGTSLSPADTNFRTVVQAGTATRYPKAALFPPPPPPSPDAAPGAWDAVSAAAAAWTGAGLAVAEVRATVLLSVGTHPASAAVAAAAAAATRTQLTGQGYSERPALPSGVGAAGPATLAGAGFLPPPQARCVHLPAGCTAEPIAVWHSVTVSPPEACSSNNTTASSTTTATGACHGGTQHSAAADTPSHGFDAGMWAAAAAAAAWGGASASSMSIPQWLGTVPASLPSSHPSHASGHPGADSGITSNGSGGGSAVCSSASCHPSLRLSEFESLVNSSIYSGDRGCVPHPASSAASSPTSTTALLQKPPLDEAALAAVAAEMGSVMAAPPNSRTPSLHSVGAADGKTPRLDQHALAVDQSPATSRPASAGARSCTPEHLSLPLETMASTVSVESLISAAARGATGGASAGARGPVTTHTRDERRVISVANSNRPSTSRAAQSRMTSYASAHLLNGPGTRVQQLTTTSRRLLESESKQPPNTRLVANARSAAASGSQAADAAAPSPAERYARATAAAAAHMNSKAHVGLTGPLTSPIAPSAAVAAAVSHQPLLHGRVAGSTKSSVHIVTAQRSPAGAATVASAAAGAVSASSKLILQQQQSGWTGSEVVEGSMARMPAALVGRPGSAPAGAKPGSQRSMSAHRGYFGQQPVVADGAAGAVVKPRPLVAWR